MPGRRINMNGRSLGSAPEAAWAVAIAPCRRSTRAAIQWQSCSGINRHPRIEP